MRLVVEETEEQMGRVFLAYGTLLTVVSLFRYLRQTVLSTGDDRPEVERNLWRAQGNWGSLAKILGREGADNKTTRRFYVAVMNAVFLLGS